ncbi:uncharacterized protein LOC123263035 [Cotesia glomerata]|uniref:uncharacterized protein LOC123263035 n=1 Tax=Cotesia glomerata TaxID=32391 RepID=UPI001D032D73|nr:uncharacterized protein LOC123263035 [Cotesia glomerata]
MQLELHPTEVVLRGYGGGIIRPYGVVEAKLKIDLAEGNVKIHVVPNDLQNVPLIVGQPFLDLPGVTMVQRDGRLRLFDKTVAHLPEMEKLPPQKIALWAKETTVIPPKHAANIEVKVKSKIIGDLYVELSVRGKEGREHCIPRSMLNIETGMLLVVNLSDRPLIIYQDKIIARAERAREESLEESNIRIMMRTVKTEPQNDLPRDQILTGPEVSPSEKDALYDLLDNYRDCFASNVSELGHTRASEINIELDSNSVVTYRPY